MARIVHLTSVHPAFDARIFHKECRGLAAAGHEVLLVVPHELPTHVVDGVTVHGVPRLTGRWARMSRTTRAVYEAALRAEGDVYHFHDPELMPVGLLLKLRGRRVIYDVHEDTPRQKLTNEWIPRGLRSVVAGSVGALEWVCGRFLDGIVAATPHIAQRFPATKTVTIHNYPKLSEFCTPTGLTMAGRPRQVLYVGGISPVRGIQSLLSAFEMLPQDFGASLILAGNFSSEGFRNELARQPIWARVDFRGWADRTAVAALCGQSRAGIVTLMPTAAYLDSLPTKMFEYMAAGLPVVASNFPLWQEIIESHQCGLTVDPQDPRAIADAIDWLLNHPRESAEMGMRGRAAVEREYNWENECSRLLDYYVRILAKSADTPSGSGQTAIREALSPFGRDLEDAA